MNLTPRQHEVCQLVSAGLRDNEIAALMGITRRTAVWYVQTLFDISGMSRRVELVHWYARLKGKMVLPDEPKKNNGTSPLEQLATALQIVRAQEDYILRLQRTLAEHGIAVPEPEKQ